MIIVKPKTFNSPKQVSSLNPPTSIGTSFFRNIVSLPVTIGSGLFGSSSKLTSKLAVPTRRMF